MPLVEVLNAWGSAWAAFMLRSLVEATVLLVVVLLVWLPLRRRMSSQLAYGLFLLVLIKAAVPIPVTLPAALARLAPGRVVERRAAARTWFQSSLAIRRKRLGPASHSRCDGAGGGKCGSTVGPDRSARRP